MYHSISDGRQKGIHPYYETTTSPQVFAQHMKFLHDNKYKVIGLDQAARILKSCGRNCGQGVTSSTDEPKQPNEPNKLYTPQRYVVLTFDDGFRDFCTEVFPVLRKYQFSATVFLPTAFISNNRVTFKGTECLRWEEVRELHSKGVTFGSHTVNHARLHALPRNQIQVELKASKERIEEEVGEEVTVFSYPYAFPEDNPALVAYLEQVLKALGYQFAVTTKIGTIRSRDRLFFLKRIPVNTFDCQHFFELKIQGFYDWLHPVQSFYKKNKIPSCTMNCN